MNGKIYMIRNEVNGKRYIGQTVNSLEERFKQHKQGTRQPKKNMTKLQRAMDKYGKPMFTITMIEDHIETIELLAEREKLFIEKLNTKEEYNSTNGGENKLRNKTGVNRDYNKEETVNEFTVVFNNSLTEEVIANLTKTEYDLFMAVIGKIKGKGTEEVSISFNEIRALFERPTLGNVTLVSIANSLWKKIKLTNYFRYSRNENSSGVLLFSFWSVADSNDALLVKINPDLEYFVNDFKRGNSSSIRYSEIKQTKDIYGKLLLVLLKKRNKAGKLTLTSEELEYELDVPKAYRSNARLLNDKVLRRALVAISDYFLNLKLTKIKNGRRIVKYQFTFDKETGQKVKWVSPEERKVLAKQKRVEEKMEKQEQKSIAGSSQPANTITQEEVDSILSLYFNKDEENFG